MQPMAGFFAVCAIVLAMSPNAKAKPAALATIKVEKTAAGYAFIAHVTALSQGRFEGRMTVAKRGASGTTSSSQAGATELRTGASADLATVGINLQPNDELTVTVEVTAGGTVVSRAAMTVE